MPRAARSPRADRPFPQKAAPELRPAELLGGNTFPDPLAPCALSARELAATHRLQLAGPDRRIRAFALLSSLGAGCLGYLGSEEWLELSERAERAVIVTSAPLARKAHTKNSYLVTEGDPKDTFYLMLAHAIQQKRFSRLRPYSSPKARIAPSAIIEGNVHIEANAEIGPNVVLFPNTYVGPDVVIKANASIGGDGFEIARLSGRRRIVPHAGGVWLSRGVHVGSNACIDRGLFGDFTFLGKGTLVDNLVHIAHSVRLGRECSIVACSEISGSATLGDGVWLGPNSAINPRVHVGDHAYLGTASTVTRDIPSHALAYGSPAKIHSRVCSCRRKLDFRDGRASCSCGVHYALSADGRVRVRRA